MPDNPTKYVKTSPNEAIKDLWKLTNSHTNVQYDVYNSTKEVLKDVRSRHENKLQSQLVCQGSFFSHATNFSLAQFNSLWSSAQSKLPKNIFNFTIRYMNNCLPTRKNLTKWGIISCPDCSFCLCPETLMHVVAGCQSYLERFTWQHDSVLKDIGNKFFYSLYLLHIRTEYLITYFHLSITFSCLEIS